MYSPFSEMSDTRLMAFITLDFNDLKTLLLKWRLLAELDNHELMDHQQIIINRLIRVGRVLLDRYQFLRHPKLKYLHV
jgi:hypothetical protein